MKIVKTSNYCMIPDILIIENISNRSADKILKALNTANCGLDNRYSYEKKRKDYKLRKACLFPHGKSRNNSFLGSFPS